jgi:hypothetical protein
MHGLPLTLPEGDSLHYLMGTGAARDYYALGEILSLVEIAVPLSERTRLLLKLDLAFREQWNRNSLKESGKLLNRF